VKGIREETEIYPSGTQDKLPSMVAGSNVVYHQGAGECSPEYPRVARHHDTPVAVGDWPATEGRDGVASDIG
jgi:hypothetical protein